MPESLRLRTVIVLATVVLAPRGPLRAQTVCDTAVTQTDLNGCAKSQADSSGRRLTRLLGELARTLDSSRVGTLRRVQVLWVRYRNAHCRWDSGAVEGGSMQPMWISNCIAALTEARIAELKHSLCEGGGDCPESRKYDLAPGDSAR